MIDRVLPPSLRPYTPYHLTPPIHLAIVGGHRDVNNLIAVYFWSAAGFVFFSDNFAVVFPSTFVPSNAEACKIDFDMIFTVFCFLHSQRRK